MTHVGSGAEPGAPAANPRQRREGGRSPPPETRRWVARRKAQVVVAVRAGVLSLDDACTRYNLSSEEFAAWEQAIDRHGPGALRVTRLQEFRHG
jgi:hypothetical protein